MNILDLDHSLTGQASIARRLANGRAHRIDLLDLGPKLRLWSRSRMFKAVSPKALGGQCKGRASTTLEDGD